MNNHKLTYFVTILTASLLFSCKSIKQAKTAEKNAPIFELVAEVPNLSHCESVAFDSKRNVLYVSVQAKHIEKDGSIAKLSLDGKIIKADFITGLNNPKGIAVINDRLYVSDVTELVEIDLENEKIIKKYQGENADFLNDVAIAQNGDVYVSDMFVSSIYKLDKQGEFKKWLSSPKLENPNGLLIIDDNIFISAWGRTPNGKETTSPPQGRFLKLNIKTKRIDNITRDGIGTLDGVQIYDNDSFLVSDWKKGTILKVTKSGLTELFLQSQYSVGDFLYLAKKKVLALPINKENKVLIYKLNIYS